MGDLIDFLMDTWLIDLPIVLYVLIEYFPELWEDKPQRKRKRFRLPSMDLDDMHEDNHERLLTWLQEVTDSLSDISD